MERVKLIPMFLVAAFLLASCGNNDTAGLRETPSPTGTETMLTAVEPAAVVPAAETSRNVETSREDFQTAEDADQRAKKAERAMASIKPEDLQTVKDAVRQMHRALDRLLTYGGIKNYLSQDDEAWSVFTDPQNGLTAQFHATVDKLLPLIGDEHLRLDLLTFQRFMEIATEMRLNTSLAYAHRVIHDMDYWVFNYDADTDSVRDYWGATATLHGKEGNPYYEWLESKAYETHKNTNQG